MNMRFLPAIALGTFVAHATFASPPAQTQPVAGSEATLITIDQLRDLQTAGRYRDLVRESAAILHGDANVLSKYNLYDFQLLRGEAFIQLRSDVEAQQAFTAAAGHAKIMTRAVTARALAELARKSPHMIYHHPAAGAVAGVVASPEQTFDITEAAPDKRKAAFSALFDDEWIEAQPAARAALAASQAIDRTFAFVATGARLRDLEFAASGKTDRCDKLLKDLSDHVAVLSDPILDATSSRVDGIEQHADQVLDVTDAYDEVKQVATVVTDGPNGSVSKLVRHYRHLGFNGNGDAEILRSILAQFAVLNADLKNMMQSFGPPADALDKESKEAGKIVSRSQKMLATNYNKVVTNAKNLHRSDGE